MRAQIRILLKNNSIWAICFLVFRAGINFLITPYLTNRIGIDQYGYIALANNLVTYIDIICVAFNFFACRNIALAYHDDEIHNANSFFSTIIGSNAFLIMILGGIGSAFVACADGIINISPVYVSDVKKLFLLVLIKYFMTLFGTTLEVSEFIKDRLDISSKNKIISYVTYVLCIVILFSNNDAKVYYVGIAFLAQAAIYLILQFLMLRILTPNLRFHFHNFSILKVWYLLKNGIWIAFNNLGNVLNDGMDLLITNLMLSESIMGMISIAKLIGNLCYSAVDAVSNARRPRQLEAFSKGDVNNLVLLLNNSMFKNSCLFCVCWCSLVCCGNDFFQLWLGDQNYSNIYRLTILALLCFAITSVVNPLYYVYVLVQKVKFASFITVAMGMINLAAMYLLLKYSHVGENAVLLTTAFLNMIHLLDTPLYASYCLKIHWKTFYKPILLHFVTFGACNLWIILCMRIMPMTHNWILFAIKVLCVNIPLLFYSYISNERYGYREKT